MLVLPLFLQPTMHHAVDITSLSAITLNLSAGHRRGAG